MSANLIYHKNIIIANLIVNKFLILFLLLDYSSYLSLSIKLVEISCEKCYAFKSEAV